MLPAARRVGGQRRYDGSALRTLAVIRLAQEAGFTVAEIRILLHGFAFGALPSARWRALARRKRREIDGLMARARQMRRVLERLLRCKCPTLVAREALARPLALVTLLCCRCGRLAAASRRP